MALVTDYGFGDDNALRYSLLPVTALAVIAPIVLLGKSLGPYRESLERLKGWSAGAQPGVPGTQAASD